MRAPLGMKKQDPGDMRSKKKSSCWVPMLRWSRFLASSMRCWYSFMAAWSGNVMPYTLCSRHVAEVVVPRVL